MKSFNSLLFSTIVFCAALGFFLAPGSAFAQEANPYAADAQNEVDTINADATITDKDAAYITAMEDLIEDSPDADAPKIAAAFIEALGIDETSPLFQQIVYSATTLVPSQGSAIASAAAQAAGGSAAAQGAANSAVSQAVGDAVNSIGQQGNSTSTGVTGFSASGGSAAQGASNPNLVPAPTT